MTPRTKTHSPTDTAPTDTAPTDTTPTDAGSTDAAPIDAAPTENPPLDDPGAERGDERSWVDRCQRQFGRSERRLHNLVDDENHAMYDGV